MKYFGLILMDSNVATDSPISSPVGGLKNTINKSLFG